MKLWIAAVAATVSVIACAPALKTPAEIVDFARQPGVGDTDRLFDALPSPHAVMRSHAAWALGSLALDPLSKSDHASIAATLVRAFDAEWKRPGGPEASVLGSIIRALGNAGEAVAGERVAGFMRVLSPSLQGAVAQMALGFAARKIRWSKQLDGVVGTIAATANHPHRKVALIAAVRNERALPFTTLDGAMRSRDPEVRAVAVKLARFSKETPVTHLDSLLNDLDWRVQVEAARALVHRGEASRVAEFASRLWRRIQGRAGDVETTKGIVVLAALEVLVGAKSMTPAARAALEEIHATAKAASLVVMWAHCRAAMILDALDQTSTRTGDCGNGQIPRWRRAGLAADLATKLPRESAAVAKLAAPFLASPDPKVRAAIMPAVVHLSPEKARPIFLESLASADPVIAAVAADTLVSQPPKRFRRLDFARAVIAALKRHANGNNVEATISLAMAAFQYPPGEADAALHDLATHAEPSVAAMARLDRFHDHTRGHLSRPSSWAVLDALAANPSALPKTARIETTRGTIEIRFHSAEAPRTVANFAGLARKGFYNGLDFHRVVPNFVIQGGDPRGDGFGGPGYTIPCEPSFNERSYIRGSVGMALAGRHTGGSQFFITQSAHPHLDGRYTNFATVTAGMDVVDRIVVGDKIVRVTVD